MASTAMASFKAAMIRYRRARAGVRSGPAERELDRIVGEIDDALDELLAIPSPSLLAFGQKIEILEVEYGVNIQPRHAGALYADAHCMDWRG
jgi:hypothetical protein